jgi:hypothetical protein
MSEAVTNTEQALRADSSWRLIAYDEHLDVSVFLSDHGRVIVHDGRAMSSWTVAEPELDLRDWLPPGQFDLAMRALRRYSNLY